MRSSPRGQRALVAWEGKEGAVTANLPLVTSAQGGAAVVPFPLTAPAAPGTAR